VTKGEQIYLLFLYWALLSVIVVYEKEATTTKLEFDLILDSIAADMLVAIHVLLYYNVCIST